MFQKNEKYVIRKRRSSLARYRAWKGLEKEEKGFMPSIAQNGGEGAHGALRTAIANFAGKSVKTS